MSFVYGEENSFKIYLSVNGNDNSSGILEEEPIHTLKRAQNILYEQRPNTSIEIHIEPGIYIGQSIVWKFSNNHSITFTSANFGKDRPVFDGKGMDRTWFRLNSSAGKSSNLRFRYIKVQNYKSALVFRGNRLDKEKYNSNNEIYGMWFDRIGQKFVTVPTDVSTSVINFINSRNNSVRYSYFSNLLNTDSDSKAHAIHAIYISHYSSNNKIIGNKFRTSNGDPIKVRDSSNNNYQMVA
jgi:hypothetical protein